MKRPVLIADGQEIRRGRLADGLAACGVEVEQVGDGASALELALSRRPTLVIADMDLPLVDAPKLAEIMRANPRTRAARFVFLGDGARFVNSCGPGDVLLPADSAMEDLVATVKAELEILQRLTPLMGVLEREEQPSGNFPDPSGRIRQSFQPSRVGALYTTHCPSGVKVASRPRATMRGSAGLSAKGLTAARTSAPSSPRVE